MVWVLVLTLAAAIVLYVSYFLRSPRFGGKATGKRLQAMQASPHFSDGKFQNESFTPDLQEGTSYYTVLRDFIFNKSKRARPTGVIPAVATNLNQLPANENLVVWFGHSSYYLQVDGKRMLVDPVFSGHASPVNFTTKSFSGTDVFTAENIPPIDILFISHDHWDHLDYKTIIQLKPKIKRVVTGLGTGAHLVKWGIDENIIEERDWYENFTAEDGVSITATPARHFSGRSFKRNQFLWVSFVLQTPTMKIYLGGDSGYDSHFKKIGEKYGPFDLALLECGQYNVYWKYIHMMPEQVVQAAIDLKATRFIPVHWGKFSLALHAWDEPILRVTAEAKKQGIPALYARIGEPIYLQKTNALLEWWKDVD